MNTTFFLAASGAAVVPVSDGRLPKTRNGLPCFYYRRQSAKDGEYTTGNGIRLSITPERRRTWERAFLKMKLAGVEVPIVADHQQKAGNVLGYVVGVENEGPWYEEIHQYIGEEARDTALRNQVSLGIQPDFKDGYGRSYGEVVQHSAVTPVPVIPGQGDAVPIAASLFRLASDAATPPGPNALTLPEFIRRDLDDVQLVQQRANEVDAAVRALSNLGAIEGDGGARELLAQRLGALQLLAQVALRMMQRLAQGFEGIAADTRTMSAGRSDLLLRCARLDGKNKPDLEAEEKYIEERAARLR